MTKKDYVSIARAMCDVRERELATDQEMHTHERVCARLADVLAADNAAFDRNRFLDACGIPAARAEEWSAQEVYGSLERVAEEGVRKQRVKRNLTQVEELAAACGLATATWSPGDGLTRYRFFRAEHDEPYANYNQGGELHTACGRKAALQWLKGVHDGDTARIRENLA